MPGTLAHPKLIMPARAHSALPRLRRSWPRQSQHGDHGMEPCCCPRRHGERGEAAKHVCVDPRTVRVLC
eukprot:scaffold1583_cov299-Pinguiococcus_pyrenoidosus.AAC.11